MFETKSCPLIATAKQIPRKVANRKRILGYSPPSNFNLQEHQNTVLAPRNNVYERGSSCPAATEKSRGRGTCLARRPWSKFHGREHVYECSCKPWRHAAVSMSAVASVQRPQKRTAAIEHVRYGGHRSSSIASQIVRMFCIFLKRVYHLAIEYDHTSRNIVFNVRTRVMKPTGTMAV